MNLLDKEGHRGTITVKVDEIDCTNIRFGTIN